MTKAYSVLACVMAAFTLSACVSQSTPSVSDRIEVQRAEYVHEFSFAQGQAQLSKAEQQRLRQFMSRYGITDQDRLVVTIPSNIGGTGFAARKAHMQRLLAPTGAGSIVLGSAPGELDRSAGRGIVRVVRPTKLRVTCQSDDGWQPGCASSRNLAAMISNPNDLILPVGNERPLYTPGARGKNKPDPAPGMSQ